MEQRTHTPTQPPSLTTRGPIQSAESTRVRDALHALCSPTPEPWPAGVIARYLTVAGATVDLTRSNDPADENANQWDATRAACAGCGACDAQGWSTRPYGVLISIADAEKNATGDMRKWAQRHAEICRALPRPAVTQ